MVAVAQTNDGLEPGVGFHVDQVYYARPATAAFNLFDLDRIEVLRGPQGTPFSKNTTAGAMTIVTRAPAFERNLRAEVSYGNYGHSQMKLALAGSLWNDQIAGRFSLMTNRRDGILDNTTTRG